MNKYYILIAIAILIIGAGIVYRILLLPSESAPVTTGKVREVTITARKLTWQWYPSIIEVERGDKVIATVINEDDFDHGFAVDAFGISQRMPANSTIKVEFVATQEGEFPFYCSVPCGKCEEKSCEINGVRYGHFDQIGKFIVKQAIK